MKVIDMFAGCGGFSLGAEAAGLQVLWAGNHWAQAVEVHALNHPNTQHVCQDLRQADWTSLPMFDLLLASPACQGNSNASQPNERPYHDEMRATAWAIIDCVEVTRPKAVIVENVPQMRRRWPLYKLWVEALRVLGYHVEELLITASRHGVPQRRTRLFVVATRRPIWLDDLHDQGTATNEPAFGPCIDWGDGEWRPIKTAKAGARKRIAVAQRNHGPRCLTQHVTGHPGVPLSEPIRTITTKDQWAVVDGELYRPLTIKETTKAMGFPEDYRWPEGMKRREQIIGLGNAVPPPLAWRVIERVAEETSRRAA